MLAAVVVVELLFVTLAEPRLFSAKSPRAICRQVALRVGEAPLVFYGFDDSTCVFYMRRTATVAMNDASLRRALAQSPGAWVLARRGKEGAPLLRDRREVWRGESDKRALVLLAPRAAAR